MHNHDDHSSLIKDFYEEQKDIFETSEQAVYAYLDDEGRVCNNNFAKLLGYKSPDEWAKVNVKGSFPEAFVSEKSQEELVEAYQNAMEKGVGSTTKITWKKKSGDTVDSTVILVPVLFQGHAFALHFIS